jgi:glycine/D-amino acid oxidase-like deaminating enzyme
LAARHPLPPSLYVQTARPAPATPPLQGDNSVSVAIVGGGFTGLSAALHLAEHGTSVAVLEAHAPGWGASGRNGGQVNPGLKHDPDQVERDFGPELGARMTALAWGAPDFLFSLVRRHGIDCAASQTGTLRAALGAAEAAGLHATHAQCAARGRPVELIDRARLREHTGTDRYALALHDRSGGHVNPLSYARGLAAAAMRAGARVHGTTPVQRLRRHGPHWILETPQGTLRAEAVLLATNGYTGDLWPGLRRSVVPVYSGITASEPLPPGMARQILPSRASLYELGRVAVYYRLDEAGRLLMGGRCRQAGVGRPEQMAFLAAYAARLWPCLRGVRWTHGWNGQVAITPDHYPHLHEPAPGLLACLGYNGRGVALATAMGPQLARRLLGGASAPIDLPVTSIRTIPLHGLWKTAVSVRMLTDRLRAGLSV